MGVRTDWIYGALAAIASPVVAVRLLTSPESRRHFRRDRRRAYLGHGPTLEHGVGRTLLIHASSVGEVNATRALVDELVRSEPELHIVLSSMTETGLSRARVLFGDVLPVVRYPLDFSRSVRRFLDRVRPDAVALVELEVWPNFVEECARRSIPVGVVNGRLSEPSFRNYRRIRRWIRSAFARLDAVGAQTEEYAARFRELGVPGDRIEVTDNMKWDSALTPGSVDGAEALLTEMGIDPALPLVVAGSTGPGEEELLLRDRPDGVQLMAVPRKPERFDEVAALDPRWVRRSKWKSGQASGTNGDPDAGLFLLDTMGELERAYALADVAIVGRSFFPQGGSDPVPPIALGVPTVIGPHHENFYDVVHAFEEGEGIVVSDDPWKAVERLFDDRPARDALIRRGREVLAARRGATERSVALVRRLLTVSNR